MGFQSFTPPDGCDTCQEYLCTCDRWGDDIDRAYEQGRGK